MTIHERFPFSWKIDEMRKQKEEKDEKNLILNQGIEILDLDTRCYNALKRSAINSIGEVIEHWKRIPKIRSIGAKCKIELKAKMIRYLSANDREDLIDPLLSYQGVDVAV